MTYESPETSLDQGVRQELSALASREGASEIEMLRRLIDRAYAADLWEQTGGIKPNTPPNDG
jgi:hypothetical protein